MQDSKQQFQCSGSSGNLISSKGDRFQIQSVLKVAHRNGTVVLHAQPVIDKTNNSNEKSKRNWQCFSFRAAVEGRLFIQ